MIFQRRWIRVRFDNFVVSELIDFVGANARLKGLDITAFMTPISIYYWIALLATTLRIYSEHWPQFDRFFASLRLPAPDGFPDHRLLKPGVRHVCNSSAWQCSWEQVFGLDSNDVSNID